ncbi:MAG: hypothetical protein ACI9R3_002642 [Verrucomicrobiales bacterium]|jgi:hypothetical protein
MVSIKNISTGETIDTVTGQGYSYFRTDDVEAVWKEDSTAFAVSVRGTKTTRSTDVYMRDELDPLSPSFLLFVRLAVGCLCWLFYVNDTPLSPH